MAERGGRWNVGSSCCCGHEVRDWEVIGLEIEDR